MVRIGNPFYHSPQPAVGYKYEVTVGLDEAPLAIDLLVDDRFGQVSRPGHRPAPFGFDHGPSAGQALRVSRPQHFALGPEIRALGRRLLPH